MKKLNTAQLLKAEAWWINRANELDEATEALLDNPEMSWGAYDTLDGQADRAAEYARMLSDQLRPYRKKAAAIRAQRSGGLRLIVSNN